jgi:prepilin-type N-terminal cleavage/methylation domain-containing protein
MLRQNFSKGGFMKQNSGFTLAEVIIVIVIVGILSIIAVPIYRDHVKKALSVEGQALLSEIMAAQEIYANRNQSWFNASSYTYMAASYVPEIGVDARRNKYFNMFTWRSVGGDYNYAKTNPETVSFSITTNGIAGTRADGVSLTLNYYNGKTYEIVQE